MADQRYWAPTVGSLKRVNEAPTAITQRECETAARLHGSHFGQRSYHERGSDTREYTSVHNRRRSAIAKRELKGDSGSLPRALQHKREVHSRNQIDVSLRRGEPLIVIASVSSHLQSSALVGMLGLLPLIVNGLLSCNLVNLPGPGCQL